MIEDICMILTIVMMMAFGILGSLIYICYVERLYNNKLIRRIMWWCMLTILITIGLLSLFAIIEK